MNEKAAVGRPRDIVVRPACPVCGSNTNVVKTGLQTNKYLGTKQKWYCKKCLKVWVVKGLERVSNKSEPYEPYKKLCREVFTRSSSGTKELVAHRQLKLKACDFLATKLHCQDIQQEVSLSDGQRIIRVDVVGQSPTGTVAVECGSVNGEGKMDFLDELVTQGIIEALYIFPYGENVPYEWAYGMKICVSCGHRID